MILAVGIFLFTLTLVIWQPKKLGIGWSASLGSLLALLTGTISLSDIPVVWNIVWNATTTFIAIIIVSLILDEAGLFKWTALHVARWGAGHGKRLFTYIILLGACVSAFFANDGAALILTPIVIAMLLALGFNKGTTLAFVMAAGFIADTASLPLVISNLVNIISADFFNISFSNYAQHMLPVTLVAIISTLVVLHVFFAKDIPHSYHLESLQTPHSAIKDPLVFKLGWVVLGLLLIFFFIGEKLGLRISFIASIGALVLLIATQVNKHINSLAVMRSAPWQIVIFSLGMYLVVYGLRNQGLTDYLTSFLSYLGEQGTTTATVGTGFTIAFLSSIMNNLPTVLIGALSIDASSASGVVKEGMIYANVIGSDLGPKITPIGSLATLLWIHILSSKNIHISWGYYFKVGIILTLPVLLATLLALAGVMALK